MRLTTATWIMSCLAVACSDGGPESEFVEVRGTRLTTSADVSAFGPLAWTGDGTKIVYVAGIRSTVPSIRVVEVASGTASTLRSGCDYSGVGVGATGIVYVRDEDDTEACSTSIRRLHLVSVDGTDDTVLADPVESSKLSHIGGHVAFIRPAADSVYVIDLQTETRAGYDISPWLDYQGQIGPWPEAALAPDGGSLAYMLEDRVVFVTLADGSQRERLLPAARAALTFIRWDAAGYWVAEAAGDRVTVWNVETGLAIGSGTVPSNNWYGSVDLSPNRAALAFWDWLCSESRTSDIDGSSVCVEEEYGLHRVILSTGAGAQLARSRTRETFDSDETYSGTAFSPDGTAVAYVIDRDIYLWRSGQ